MTQGLPVADDLQVVQRVAAVGQQHGNGLGGVDDAAAAHGHQAVTAVHIVINHRFIVSTIGSIQHWWFLSG